MSELGIQVGTKTIPLNKETLALGGNGTTFPDSSIAMNEIADEILQTNKEEIRYDLKDDETGEAKRDLKSWQEAYAQEEINASLDPEYQQILKENSYGNYSYDSDGDGVFESQVDFDCSKQKGIGDIFNHITDGWFFNETSSDPELGKVKIESSEVKHYTSADGNLTIYEYTGGISKLLDAVAGNNGEMIISNNDSNTTTEFSIDRSLNGQVESIRVVNKED